jgi:multidrug transporter EmrE-like cation transporter
MAGSTKPKSVTMFNRFNLAATLIAIANILVHYALLRNLAISNGTSPAGPFLGILFLALSYLIFWFFIYRRGSKVARWIFLVFTAVSIAMVPLTLRDTLAIGAAYAIADGVSFLFQLAAAAMLFRRDATSWLGRKKDRRVDTH